MSNRIGLYGGSFDPFHLGHFIGAQDALEQVKLDELIFIPCAQSPHKPNQEPTSAHHRLRMIQVAIRGYGGFSVSDCEIKRGAPSFAIDTVHYFKEQRPRSQFFWLIGLDQLILLRTWKDYELLRKLITFVVMERPGSKRAAPRRGVIYLPQPRLIAISSTEIRNRVKKQQMIDHLVPALVARYIDQHSLYR